MQRGIIHITLENITYQELERIREILHALILCGGVHAKNGKTTLMFDETGTLQDIEVQEKRFKRNKHLTTKLNSAIIEILTEPKVPH